MKTFRNKIFDHFLATLFRHMHKHPSVIARPTWLCMLIVLSHVLSPVEMWALQPSMLSAAHSLSQPRATSSPPGVCSLKCSLERFAPIDPKGTLLVVGLGCVGPAVVRAAREKRFRVIATSRDPLRITPPADTELVKFSDLLEKMDSVTHLLLTVPPDPEAGDVVLANFKDAILSPSGHQKLSWIGYTSSTGVYGDKGGAVVDETSEPTPSSQRSIRRLKAEQAWRELACDLGLPLCIFRCGGIYGDEKYNSTFTNLRAGLARRIIYPGHSFPRIHVEDVARAIVAAADPPSPLPARAHIFHLVDNSLDTPASEVVEYCAKLLGVSPPPAVPFEKAWAGMSPVGRSFWGENVKVRNEMTKAALGIEWKYPTFREGYRAVLSAQLAAERAAQAAQAVPVAAEAAQNPRPQVEDASRGRTRGASG